jgi:transposase InsO family protein
LALTTCYAGSLWSFELVSADLTQVEWGGAYVEYRMRTHEVERSHRVDAEEFYALLDGLVVDDDKVFNNKLREWEDYHNYRRPHGGLNGQTPYERLRQKTQTRP